MNGKLPESIHRGTSLQDKELMEQEKILHVMEKKEKDSDNKALARLIGKLFMSGDDDLVLNVDEKHVLGQCFLQISERE